MHDERVGTAREMIDDNFGLSEGLMTAVRADHITTHRR